MLRAASQRWSLMVMLGVAALTAAALAAVYIASWPVDTILIYWAALGAVVAFGWYAVKGDLLTAVLIWFITLIVFHEEFWRARVPFFFALTIPRIGLVVLAALWLAMLALRRFRWRSAWPITGAIAVMAVYFLISAVVSGFDTRSIVTVHYRLIGGYLFPFAVFILILHGFHGAKDLRRLLVFFALISAYLVFTGWCERFELRSLVFPRFINDPGVGIHWGRVRGPFVASPAMGLALTFCFFSNLVLARNVLYGRWPLYILNLLMLPAIFWTKTRSVWLGFVLGGVVWVFYSKRRTTRIVGVSLLAALVLTVATVNMSNFLSEERERGGVADVEPILVRLGLAQMTYNMFLQHPLFGVGFGHFRDYAPAFARDPSSAAYAFGSSAMEHNNVLSILAETGLIGMLLYILLIVLLLLGSIGLYRRLPTNETPFINRDLLVLYWVLAAAYLIDGTFRETSADPFANCLFFGLSAVPVALSVMLRARGTRGIEHAGLRM